MKNEAAWKAELKAALKARGAAVFSIHGHATQEAGWPDLYFAHRDGRGWIELKMADGEVSTIQRIVMQRLADAGEPVAVLRLSADRRTMVARSIPAVNGVARELKIEKDKVEELIWYYRGIDVSRLEVRS
jgi:hypothetical protein